MNTDKLANAHIYCENNKNLKIAFEYLQNTDLNALENGRYEIDGNNIFAIIQDYQTKLVADDKWEAHRKYTDIQYIIKGCEKLGYLSLENFSPKTDYNEEKDVIFGNGDGSFITANAGDFVIFTPNDAHMPGICAIEPEYVKKAVVKVRIY